MGGSFKMLEQEQFAGIRIQKDSAHLPQLLCQFRRKLTYKGYLSIPQCISTSPSLHQGMPDADYSGYIAEKKCILFDNHNDVP
jgi:hypothetical protein